MKTDFSVLSSDGTHTLAGVIYRPQGEIRGFFHIVHGMREHIGRYSRIMQDLSDAGYLCFGYDNLGHGRTVTDKRDFGYIAPRDGHDLLCRDVKVFSDAVIREFGSGKKLPYFLMGHSMGSFITRLAVEKYAKPDKYIIMGSGGYNPLANAGLAVVAVIKALRGDRHVSPLVSKLAMGSYNERFGGGTAQDPSPWLSKDLAERQKHYNDPFCTFPFTVSAMGDLIRLNRDANRRQWYENMPRELPILILSGDTDPVGDYGKGITQVYADLIKTGHNAQMILYPNTRHEILNDDSYPQVKADILAFLENP